MKVLVTGATGVLGQSAIQALLINGHEVVGLVRSAEGADVVRGLGADAVDAAVFDLDAMTAAMRGCDAICNLMTNIPVGRAGLRRGAWKVNDRLRAEGSGVVVEAARLAGVRRLVQESVSFLYADGGDEWISEKSPLSVTRAGEPSAVAECNATRFSSASHAAVVLRFGNIIGDDAMTRWRLSQARSGHAIGIGDPQGWAHVVHPVDAGTAVAAALTAPNGVYNVGAEPVRRHELTRVLGESVGRPDVGFLPKLLVKMAGERLELVARSHRVSSDRLHQVTGWKPSYEVFDASWLRDVVAHG